MEFREEFVGLAQDGSERTLAVPPFRYQPDDGIQVAGPCQGRRGADGSFPPSGDIARTLYTGTGAQVMVSRAAPGLGARKLARRLKDQGVPMPAISTVHAILVRHRA